MELQQENVGFVETGILLNQFPFFFFGTNFPNVSKEYSGSSGDSSVYVQVFLSTNKAG